MTSTSISANDAFNPKIGSLTSTNLGQGTETAYEQMKAWKDSNESK